MLPSMPILSASRKVAAFSIFSTINFNLINAATNDRLKGAEALAYSIHDDHTPSCTTNEQENLREFLIDYTQHKVDRKLLDRIKFKKNSSPASLWPSYDRQPLILINPNYSSHTRSSLLHELGHLHYQDTINNIFFTKVCCSLVFASSIFTRNTLSGAAISFFMIPSLAFSSALLSRRLFSRYQESRADNFAIDCLKKKGREEDYLALKATAANYKDRHNIYGHKSRTFTKLGISQNYFLALKNQSKIFEKTIGLIDDVHPSDYDRWKKFEQAAQKMKAKRDLEN